MSNSLLSPSVDPIPRLALRRPEMAEALGVSERTLSGWDDVPTVKINGTLMYPIEPLKKWLAEQAANQSIPKPETATDQ
jgi:hypothetical protein